MDTLDGRYFDAMEHADAALERAQITLESDLLDPNEINQRAEAAVTWRRQRELRPRRLVGGQALSRAQARPTFRSDLG